MRTIPQNLIDEKNKEGGPPAWIWLIDVTISETVASTITARLVSFPRQVSFGGDTYHPFPIRLSRIEEDDKGTRQQLQLQISNVTREAAQWLHIGEGLIGKRVRGRAVHHAHLLSGDVALDFTFHVKDAGSNAEAVVLRLAQPHWLTAKIPSHRYVRDRCRFVYMDPDTCKYNGSLPDCVKTSADCRTHGDDEVTNNLPPLHPRRFGGAPGIPRSRR